MKLYKLKQLQLAHGYDQLQQLIDTGMAWNMEGAIGRAAMDALNSGACFLPTSPQSDYYGNVVPSRYMVKKGTKGSYANSVSFYSK
jgi:hypothetical protein